MKQIYYSTETKTEIEDGKEINFYFFHFPIQINGLKGRLTMYKVCIQGDRLELDKEHMKSVRNNTWKDTDNYSIVSFKDTPMTVYYK